MGEVSYRRTVKRCADCPFVGIDQQRATRLEWIDTCGMMDDRLLPPRPLGGEELPAPPEWCPLRRNGVLVVLEP